jgi:chromosome segregation ATPase
MKTPIFRAGLAALGALALSAVVGCSSVPEVTKERVARGATTVQQAEQTVGRSEAGAVELQRAKNNLEQAQAALNKKQREPAERYAQLAQLDAELAVAKSQSAAARRAADELLASIKTLREEVARGVVASDQ